MMKGWVSFSAARSESNECPTRIVRGVSMSSKRFWTSARVVVTGSSFSAVIPEKLALWSAEVPCDQELSSRCEVVNDRLLGLDKLIHDDLTIPSDQANSC